MIFNQGFLPFTFEEPTSPTARQQSLLINPREWGAISANYAIPKDSFSAVVAVVDFSRNPELGPFQILHTGSVCSGTHVGRVATP